MTAEELRQQILEYLLQEREKARSRAEGQAQAIRALDEGGAFLKIPNHVAQYEAATLQLSSINDIADRISRWPLA